jgi:ferredoxin
MRRRALRVVVDFDTCRSNAVCMGILPQVFEVRDDGYLYVLDEHPAEELRGLVEQAVTSCPTQSISIVEE